MIRNLLQALRVRLGLRSMTCARRNRSPYHPAAPFKIVQRDGIPMIEPRTAR